MTAPMTIRTALAAMLRATAPGEASLPENERLAAVRFTAGVAFNSAYTAWNERTQRDGIHAVGADVLALGKMLSATASAGQFYSLVEARVAAQAALAEPETTTDADQAAVHGMTIGQFVTAKAFAEHERRVAETCLPGVRAGEWERLNPFVSSDGD